MVKGRFAISFHNTIMALIAISVLLSTIYINQLASSQSQVPPDGLHASSNSSSHFIFPSQQQFFFPSINATRQTDLAILNGTWTVENSRAISQSLAGLDPHPPKMAFVVDHYLPSNETDRKIHLRIYDPGVRSKPSPALVFVHGGGWSVGTIDDFDSSIRRLTNSSGLVIAAMDYRLAPENPFPAGLNDVVATVEWIKENGESIGIDPNRIALGGDSAGANLALGSAIALRNGGQGDALRALYLLYGLYTPDKNTESMRLFGNGEYGITKTQFQWVMNLTFQRPEDWSNPLAFPLLDNLTGNLPPMYIAAMGLDPLRDDSILLAEKLRLAGQEHYLSIWPGVAHGFQEERGNMGQIVVVAGNSSGYNRSNQTGADSETNNISMFDWQYQLQNRLQKPSIVNYTDVQLTGIQESTNNNGHMIAHDNTTSFTEPIANASGAPIPEHRPPHDNNNRSGGGGVMPSNHEISIVEGSGNPSSSVFYDPLPATVKRGNSVTWINNDSLPHTATSGNPDNGEAAPGTLFDTGILGPGQSSEGITINADAGTYDYYCTLHPYMKGQLTIEE